MPSRDIDHLMTSGVNKWPDITQCTSILCFTYIFVRQTRKNSELDYAINRLSHWVLVIVISINPRPLFSSRADNGVSG